MKFLLIIIFVTFSINAFASSKDGCEGVLAKVVETLDAFVVYPNPTDGIFEIAIPNSQTEVTAEIYNVHSQLLERKVFTVKNGKIQMNITGKPEGVYLIKLLVHTPVTLKIIKQ